mgnify:CR=1 FL=1
MLSNDILRSVRYILKANNNDLVRILALGNVEATAEQIAVWLRKEDEEGFQRCPDIVLSSFLNGLIYETFWQSSPNSSSAFRCRKLRR